MYGFTHTCQDVYLDEFLGKYWRFLVYCSPEKGQTKEFCEARCALYEHNGRFNGRSVDNINNNIRARTQSPCFEIRQWRVYLLSNLPWVSFNFRSISIKFCKWEYCWCNKFNKLDQSKKYSSKFLMVVLSLPISITLKFLARICGSEQTERANKIFSPMKMKITSTQLVCFNSKKVCDQPTSLAHSTSYGASLFYKWRTLVLTSLFIAPAKILQNLLANCKIQRKN